MIVNRYSLVFACLISNMSMAATSTYDFRQDRAFSPSSLSFNGAAGTVEVSATNSASLTSYAGASSRYGLLACSGAVTPAQRWDCGGPSYGDEHWIDGSSGDGADESIVLNFDSTVRLVAASFYTNYGYQTDFDLFVDGILVLDEQRTGPHVEFDNSSAFVGTSFRFLADGAEDYFKLQAVEVAEVPLPAALWLFASGLMGLATITRKRSGS